MKIESIRKESVKDRLLLALISFAGQKDWSKLTVSELIQAANVARASFYRNFTSIEDIIEYGIQQLAEQYHQGMSFDHEDFHSREVMLYKFQFYKAHAKLVLAFHHANMSTTLLDVITNCEIDACGDMSIHSITRYEVYYYAGAFYHMMVHWLENGTKESCEEMANEFLRIRTRA